MVGGPASQRAGSPRQLERAEGSTSANYQAPRAESLAGAPTISSASGHPELDPTIETHESVARDLKQGSRAETGALQTLSATSGTIGERQAEADRAVAGKSEGSSARSDHPPQDESASTSSEPSTSGSAPSQSPSDPSSSANFSSSGLWSNTPAYAAATLAYGVQVDPFCLVFTARAYPRENHAWKFLNACVERSRTLRKASRPRASTASLTEAQQPSAAQRQQSRRLSSSSKGSSSSSSRLSLLDLPTEVLSLIRHHAITTAVAEAECLSWMFFGEDSPEYRQYHPQYCCQKTVSEIDWPGIVQEAWLAARDAFRDHFSYGVPRCEDPCSVHPVCQTVHDFLRDFSLCLADCPFDVDCVPMPWLISPLDPRMRNRITQGRASAQQAGSMRPADAAASTSVPDQALDALPASAPSRSSRVPPGVPRDSKQADQAPDTLTVGTGSEPTSASASSQHTSAASASSVKWRNISSRRSSYIHHVSLDTDRLDEQQVRRTKTISPDWQDRQVRYGRKVILKCLRETLLEQPYGTRKEPDFWLVCIVQKNT